MSDAYEAHAADVAHWLGAAAPQTSPVAQKPQSIGLLQLSVVMPHWSPSSVQDLETHPLLPVLLDTFADEDGDPFDDDGPFDVAVVVVPAPPMPPGPVVVVLVPPLPVVVVVVGPVVVVVVVVPPEPPVPKTREVVLQAATRRIAASGTSG